MTWAVLSYKSTVCEMMTLGFPFATWRLLLSPEGRSMIRVLGAFGPTVRYLNGVEYALTPLHLKQGRRGLSCRKYGG